MKIDNHNIKAVKPAIANGVQTGDKWVLVREAQQWISPMKTVQLCGVSGATIYEFIRSDPTFPYRNVGMVRKYQVDRIALQLWIKKRTTTQRSKVLSIPTADELMSRMRMRKRK